MDWPLAFTLEQTAYLSGIPEQRIRSWDRMGVLRPSLTPGGSPGASRQIYSFRDVVGLRTLAALRDDYGVSREELRRVGRWLTAHRGDPWSTLRFLVRSGEVLFCNEMPEVCRSSDRDSQIAKPFDIEQIATETKAAATKLTERRADQIGEIRCTRSVMSNAPVIAGTRIPTAAIWDFHQAGYSTGAIVEEYPRLTPLDVERAIAFEREQRSLNRRVG